MAEATKEILSAREGIAATNRSFEAAFNAGDPGRAAQDVYTREAWLLPPGAPVIQGRDNIAQFWKGAAQQMGVERVELTTLELDVGSESASEIGRAKLTIGGGQQVEAKYVVVWKKEGAEWRWHIDIWNMDA